MLNSLICNNMYKDMWAQFQTKRMTGLPHLLSLFSFRSTSGFVFVQPHFPALELGPRFGPLFTTSVAKDKPIWPFQKCSNMFQRFSEMRMLQVVPQWFQLVPIGSTVVPIGSNWFQLVPIGSNCWYKCSVKTNFDFQQWQFLWQLVPGLWRSRNVGCRQSASWHDQSASGTVDWRKSYWEIIGIYDITKITPPKMLDIFWLIIGKLEGYHE